MRLRTYNLTFKEHSGGALIERRKAKRFQVDWQVRVESDEGRILEDCILQNISSTGALIALSGVLPTSAQIYIYIKLPQMEKKWMRYPAAVVRTEVGLAAVKFQSRRPDFSVLSSAG